MVFNGFAFGFLHVFDLCPKTGLCRTDNAVKNRFTTLCKKRAKREALAKENSNAFINVNNKRVFIDNAFHSQGLLHITSPLKKLRYNSSSINQFLQELLFPFPPPPQLFGHY